MNESKDNGRCDAVGRAFAGSQRQIQLYVTQSFDPFSAGGSPPPVTGSQLAERTGEIAHSTPNRVFLA